MSTRFSEHTRNLLRHRPVSMSLVQISKDCPSLKVNWLRYFIRTGGGDADNIETLYCYLTDSKPELLPIASKHLGGK